MGLDGHFCLVYHRSHGCVCIGRHGANSEPLSRLELFAILPADTHQVSAGDMNLTCCTYAAHDALQRPDHGPEARGDLLCALPLGPPHLAQINVLDLLSHLLALGLDLASGATTHKPLR